MSRQVTSSDGDRTTPPPNPWRYRSVRVHYIDSSNDSTPRRVLIRRVQVPIQNNTIDSTTRTFEAWDEEITRMIEHERVGPVQSDLVDSTIDDITGRRRIELDQPRLEDNEDSASSDESQQVVAGDIDHFRYRHEQMRRRGEGQRENRNERRRQ